MDLKTYQEEAKKTAIYPNIGNNFIYPTLGLAGEAGEVANKIKKVIRDGVHIDKYKPELKKEIGDVLWYLATLASELEMDLGEIAQDNLDKLNKRFNEGKISGDGDNR